MVTWAGESGTNYEFQVHRNGEPIPAAPGNYIFVRSVPGEGYYALYIGQSSNLANRLTPQHEKLPCAQQRNMNEIHYHANRGGEQARLNEEIDLIQKWTPPCNDQ